MRQFLGFAGYYRRFIKDFAAVARPLSTLNAATGKTKRKKGTTFNTEPRPWQWGPEQEDAFKKLKRLLSEPPILGYADYGRPFELHVEASRKGLGGVLYQCQDGVEESHQFCQSGR